MKNKFLKLILPVRRKFLNSKIRSIQVSPRSRNQLECCTGVDYFCIDDQANIRVFTKNDHEFSDRWSYIQHCDDQRYAFLLFPGEILYINDKIFIDIDTKLFVRYTGAYSEGSRTRLICEISFNDTHKNISECIALFPVRGRKQERKWRCAEIDVGFMSGKSGLFQVRCTVEDDSPGSGNDALAIAELCIARSDLMAKARARTFKNLRSRNELAHFSQVYKHKMYSKMQDRLSDAVEGRDRPVRRLKGAIERQEHNIQELRALDDELPLKDESAYAYAHRLLAGFIGRQPPDFSSRLALKSAERPLRVLSLCCGAARIEAAYSLRVGDRVEWTLLDINRDLLRMAATQFAPSIKVDLVEGDVNCLEPTGEKWDIIMCVSALHHVVELENVIGFCHKSLTENGEFWSVGENIGRNGNRLWPDARIAANLFFRQLPDRLRLNSHTGEIDEEIPDKDYSVGCFEGIRSEEIIDIINSYFVPLDVHIRNCFLWRLVNLAYSDNYDLQDQEDRQWLQQAALHEYQFFTNGGRGTELFGVFRK